jgi:hypothetical protein
MANTAAIAGERRVRVQVNIPNVFMDPLRPMARTARVASIMQMPWMAR